MTRFSATSAADATSASSSRDSIEVNVREASSAASDARASAPPVPPRSIASTTAASKAAAASSRATAFPFATAATARCPASLIRALSATSAREPARREGAALAAANPPAAVATARANRTSRARLRGDGGDERERRPHVRDVG